MCEIENLLGERGREGREEREVGEGRGGRGRGGGGHNNISMNAWPFVPKKHN